MLRLSFRIPPRPSCPRGRTLTPFNRRIRQGKERGAVTTRTRREARLKPEFAHLYPPLKAGQWASAAAMANKLVAWLVGKKKHGYAPSERLLRPEHFEFRDWGT